MEDGGGHGGGDHGGGGDMRMLVSILADGEEQARRLVGDDDGGRAEKKECCCRELIAMARQLRRALGKAVAVAKAIEASRGSERYSDSPRSAADERSGATLAVCKRRKGLARWSQKFRMADANLDYTPEDGFSWRKYGQKDILGAKFPRAYYRCTYRSAQGCPATRQVQRSDTDAAVFDVTYQGDHVCHRRHAVDMNLLARFRSRLKVETTDESAGVVMAPSQQACSVPSFSPSSQVGNGEMLLLPPGGGFSPSSSSSSPPYLASAAAVGTRGGGADKAKPQLGGDVVPTAVVDPDVVGFDYSMYEFHADLDDPAAFHHGHGHDQPYLGEW